ncbi:MAG TPA: hypothetical protein VJ738_10295 [Steroidobacteraceae bacterium]|nr:hypothetical protein [Steroidobacteraceae bacterium]
MTTRRIPAPLLYGPNTPARWLRTLAGAIDQAAAGLCCQKWQHDIAPRLQPVSVAVIAPSPSRLK